jgi:hypothetical protein
VAAVLVYSLRRTSARIVLAFAIGGLIWAVWSAVRPAGTTLFLTFEGYSRFEQQPASGWDIAFAGLGLLVALVVSAALWYERSTSR